MREVFFKDDSGFSYESVPAGWLSYETNPKYGETRVIDGILHYVGSIFTHRLKHQFNPFKKTAYNTLWYSVKDTEHLKEQIDFLSKRCDNFFEILIQKKNEI